MTTDITASIPAEHADESAVLPLAEILRDIARGGLTGAIVGIVGAGIGGRIAMRLAALFVPEAKGAFTSNGFPIGVITFDGTVGLVLAGLVIGLLAGTVWVVISPWIPGAGLGRAILSIPIAIGIGASGLIEPPNSDFLILRNDPRVAATLVLLVAVIGLLFGLIDDWLDRRLPHAAQSGRDNPALVYAILTGLGAVLIFPIAVFGFLGSNDPAKVRLGVGLVAVGLATLAWWALRLRGHAVRPRNLTVAGRFALSIAVLLGYAAIIPAISYALGRS
jgi:hypothetical protein